MIRLIFGLLISAASISNALAWGDRGHSIVAELAERRLEPVVRQKIEALLGPGVSMASIASWADAVRLLRPETSNWHFVDIPVGATAYVPAEHCKPSPKGDCVVAALGRLRDALIDTNQSQTTRREALMFIVHFIGDLHQPLHAAERNNDEGGNKVRVIWLDRDHLPVVSNLHRYWDFGAIERKVFDWGAYVVNLEEGWLVGKDIPQLSAGDPATWAWESHQQAVNIAYGKLPENLVLDDAYYNAAIAVVDQQLAIGGLRLARFLNDALR